MDRDAIYPTYSLPETLAADTASWIMEQQGDGPVRLSEVTDLCAQFGVSATLRDAHGSIVGTVDASGDYRVS